LIGKISVKSSKPAASIQRKNLFALSFCVTVGKVRSPESRISARAPLALDLNLPDFDRPLAEHWPSAMSWSAALRHFAPARARYMREFDSPEKRLRDKNPQRFEMP
jgi:hypothetical protein